MPEPTRDPGAVLQSALLDLIAGARALLDVVEEVVQDPSGVARVVETTISGVRSAADGVTGGAWPPAGERSSATASDAAPSARPRVTRIRVQ